MSLYRRYRPQVFADVVGQEPIITTLKNSLKANTLAHAYLFCGCRGTGKTTLARLLAKAINCDALTDQMEPCGVCPSCEEITQGRNLNVLEIDGASNRGIDDMRKINETVSYAPSFGKCKIYIIDEVHMLTKEAFNALLKTLEEPPAHVKFFFATTEPHKVLPTIISRCQRFDLNRIPLDAMATKLAKVAKDLGVPCEQAALETLVLLSEGSLRDAESLLEQVLSYGSSLSKDSVEHILRLTPASDLFALDEAIHHQNYPYAFTLATSLFTAGKDLGYFIKSLISHFQNHLHLQYRLSLNHLTAEMRGCYQKTCVFYTEEQCILILEYLIDWEQKIHHINLTKPTLEMILLYLIRSKYRISLSALTKRLLALEASLKVNSSKEMVSSPEIPAPIEKAEKKEESTPLEVPEENTNKPFLKQIAPTPPKPAQGVSTAAQETLIRFAAVELEGVIKK